MLQFQWSTINSGFTTNNFIVHLGNEDEHKDNRWVCDSSQTRKRYIGVWVSASSCKNDTNQRYQNQTSHIDDHGDLLGVIQGSHFDLSRLESKVDGDKLKQQLVGVGYA